MDISLFRSRVVYAIILLLSCAIRMIFASRGLWEAEKVILTLLRTQ